MALIILGSYMIRYPLGGNLLWAMQWVAGLKALGHEVIFVEKGNYPDSCFDPLSGRASDDPTTGIEIVNRLLVTHGLQDSWCFVDFEGRHYGLGQAEIHKLFARADLFIDMGTHGSWLQEARESRRRVLIELEPGYSQIRFVCQDRASDMADDYDDFYTNGYNIGTELYTGPTAGIAWKHVLNPVCLDHFRCTSPPNNAAITTVMNWQAHEEVVFEGISYGQKDIEFVKFIGLPSKAGIPMEISVAGRNVPRAELEQNGWQLRNAHEITNTVQSYLDYIEASLAEFSVCKNVFVDLCTGWFSDRSAAYLACGRPVILQDTGFSRYLPCGEGLFAVKDLDEASHAITAIIEDYSRHTRKARLIAEEYFNAHEVLGHFLLENGISS